MDLFELSRPDHVDDDSWDAVTLARSRVRIAWESEDFPEVIGKAKELVETIARVVVVATEGTVGDTAEFSTLVSTAQKQLARAPGDDTSQDQNLRAIANGARSLVTGIAPLRNAFGTGHGRAHVPDVAEEMVTVVLEAAMLWSRWALRRLGHLLADYPNDLIAAVQTATGRNALHEKFSATVLPQQSVEIQRSIGVAFGRQSAGGFGNATEVGVDPAIHGGYDEFPLAYRLGLLEGMLVSANGMIALTAFYVPRFVDLLGTVPEQEAAALLNELVLKAGSATWPQLWRKASPVRPSEVVAALRDHAYRLPEALQPPLRELIATLGREADEAASQSPPPELTET